MLQTARLESHGPESYGNWEDLLGENPLPAAPWLRPRAGAYPLDDDCYAQSGGIFLEPVYYTRLFRDPRP